MKRTTYCTRTVVGIALAAALVPGAAFASTGTLEAASVAASVEAAQSSAHEALADTSGSSLISQFSELISNQADEVTEAAQVAEAAEFEVVSSSVSAVKTVAAEATRAASAQPAPVDTANKMLAYDPAAIEAIGTQESTGHTICCPSFSCAYADAVLDGTIHSHDYYTCSCCSWTDWGGGNSSFRCVGTDEQLLREAYDQISAGRPTVIHVAASYGEHWIALIGYEGAVDPDHLTLANFIALDPWDGALINAASRFTLYGDGCEHISDR